MTCAGEVHRAATAGGYKVSRRTIEYLVGSHYLAGHVHFSEVPATVERALAAKRTFGNNRRSDRQRAMPASSDDAPRLPPPLDELPTLPTTPASIGRAIPLRVTRDKG